MMSDGNFGERLKAARKAAKMSQYDVADLTLLGQTRISALERGAVPREGEKQKLASVFPQIEGGASSPAPGIELNPPAPLGGSPEEFARAAAMLHDPAVDPQTERCIQAAAVLLGWLMKSLAARQ